MQSVPSHQRDFYLNTEAEALESGVYLGSWFLVSKLLTSLRVLHRLDLCDNNAGIIRKARANALGYGGIELRKVPDGFAAAANADADLVFVDPFIAWGDSRRLADTLEGRPFLIWYPIFRATEPDDLVVTTELTGCEVLWSRLHRNVSPVLRGCGLLVSTSLQPLLGELSNSLFSFATSLGWQFHLRTSREVA